LIPAATGLVKSAAEFINLFRTDTEFVDQDVSVDARMVVTFLVNDLLTTNAAPCQINAIYYPSVYPLGIKSNSSTSGIMVAYRNLLNDLSRGDGAVAENKRQVETLTAQIAELDAKIAELQKTIKDINAAKGKKDTAKIKQAEKEIEEAKDKKSRINYKIKRLNQTADQLESFKNNLSDMLKLLTGTDATNNSTVLAALLRSERLKDILKSPNTYALDLVVTASGTNRITKNFFFNARVSHSAGITINAVLFNNQDQMVFGENQDYYIEFTNSKEIRRRARFKNLEEIVNR